LAADPDRNREREITTMTTACSACRLAETAARAAWIAGHIHQVRPGQWVVAQRDSRTATWTASMSPRSQRLSGCSQVSSRSLCGIADDGSVRRYASRASAVRSAKQQIEWEMDSAICSEHRAQINADLDAERDREAAEIERTWRVSV